MVGRVPHRLAGRGPMKVPPGRQAENTGALLWAPCKIRMKQTPTFGGHHSLTKHASAGMAQILNLNNLCRGGLALADKLVGHARPPHKPLCSTSVAFSGRKVPRPAPDAAT